MHSSLMVSETSFLGCPVVAFVAGEGDPGVLGHLVDLQTVGLGGLVVALIAGVAATLVHRQLVLAQVTLARGAIGATAALPPSVSLQKDRNISIKHNGTGTSQ